MAKLFKVPKLFFLVALILFISASSSSARLLRDQSLSAAVPELKLDIPAALSREYGPLLLGFLPKGRIPPSGPSKGTNDFNT